MAISPKNEEQLQEFETSLLKLGERLSPTEISEAGDVLKGKKLIEGLRAALYIEALHQRDQNRDWDKLLPVDGLMATLREEL